MSGRYRLEREVGAGGMYDERSPSAFCIAHDPLLDSLRHDERFRAVMRRLAFPVVGAQRATEVQ